MFYSQSKFYLFLNSILDPAAKLASYVNDQIWELLLGQGEPAEAALV